MWNESLAVNSVNLVNITAYNSTYIEFFLGDYFFCAPCMLSALYAIVSPSVYVSLCPPVCRPSHGWIGQKRLKLGL